MSLSPELASSESISFGSPNSPIGSISGPSRARTPDQHYIRARRLLDMAPEVVLMIVSRVEFSSTMVQNISLTCRRIYDTVKAGKHDLLRDITTQQFPIMNALGRKAGSVKDLVMMKQDFDDVQLIVASIKLWMSPGDVMQERQDWLEHLNVGLTLITQLQHKRQSPGSNEIDYLVFAFGNFRRFAASIRFAVVKLYDCLKKMDDLSSQDLSETFPAELNGTPQFLAQNSDTTIILAIEEAMFQNGLSISKVLLGIHAMGPDNAQNTCKDSETDHFMCAVATTLPSAIQLVQRLKYLERGSLEEQLRHLWWVPLGQINSGDLFTKQIVSTCGQLTCNTSEMGLHFMKTVWRKDRAKFHGRELSEEEGILEDEEEEKHANRLCTNPEDIDDLEHAIGNPVHRELCRKNGCSILGSKARSAVEIVKKLSRRE